MGFKKIAIYLILLFLCFGCSKESNTTKLLLDWYPNPVHVPIYVGQKLGYFEKEQIQLEVIKLVEPPSSIPYLLSKKVDVALYYMPQMLKVFPKTDQICIIGKLIDKPLQGFCSLDQEIKSPKDFHGKIIGGSPNGTNAKILQHLEKSEGIKVGNMIKIQFDLILALISNKVDIISGIFKNIEPKKLEAMGREATVFSYEDLGAPSYSELIFLTHKSQDPSFAERFRRAIQKSIDFAVANPEKAFEIYMEALPEKDKDWEWEAWKETISLLPTSQSFDQEELQALANWLQELGVITEPLDLEALHQQGLLPP